MTNDIEKLKTEVNDIKKSLNVLKNNVTLSEVDKKNQAEELNRKADATKEKLKDNAQQTINSFIYCGSKLSSYISSSSL